jgi:hypothetical protein
MIICASTFIHCSALNLKGAIEDCRTGGPFGGDALCNFFNYNPFGPPDYDREYERYCLVEIQGRSNEEVDKRYADEDLGKKLFEKIRKKCQSNEKNRYLFPLCCSPRRMKDTGELMFWINTGRSTQIDGWKTEKEINEYLESDGLLVDTMGG